VVLVCAVNGVQRTAVKFTEVYMLKCSEVISVVTRIILLVHMVMCVYIIVYSVLVYILV